MRAAIAGGQLARRYRHYRTSNTWRQCVQAAYESRCSRCGAPSWAAAISSCMRPAGWRAGWSALREIRPRLRPATNARNLPRAARHERGGAGLDAIREVGPGGHFFGAAHTLARYATAFYAPMVSDWRNFQQWDAAGRPLAVQRANAVWKQALAEYREPAIDPAIRKSSSPLWNAASARVGKTDF